MITFPQVQSKITVLGSSLTFEDATSYPVELNGTTYSSSEVNYCVVVHEPSYDNLYVESGGNHNVFLPAGEDITVNAFLAPIKETSTAPNDSVVWYGDKLYYKDNSGTVTEITNDNTDLIYNLNDEYFHTYKMVIQNESSLYNITKEDTHKFNISFTDNVTRVDYTVKNYAGDIIFSGTNSGNVLSFIFEEDDVYSVEFVSYDSSENEVSSDTVKLIDVSDADKCYMSYMKSQACTTPQCECNDEKLLSLSMLYSTLRDVMNANISIKGAILSESEYDENYIENIGLIVNKLKILTNPCNCKE